jgi:non-ribosomal peptide synthetase component F
MTEVSPGKHQGTPRHFLNDLKETFAGQAGRAAIHYKDRTLTYGELEARATRFAARLRGLGIEPGDRVAITTAEKLPIWGRSSLVRSRSL